MTYAIIDTPTKNAQVNERLFQAVNQLGIHLDTVLYMVDVVGPNASYSQVNQVRETKHPDIVIVAYADKDYRQYSYTTSYPKQERQTIRDWFKQEEASQTMTARTSTEKQIRTICNKWAGNVKAENIFLLDITGELPQITKPFVDGIVKASRTEDETIALWHRATQLDIETIGYMLANGWADELQHQLEPNWIICPNCNKPTYFNPFAEYYTTKEDYNKPLDKDTVHCEHCQSYLK